MIFDEIFETLMRADQSNSKLIFHLKFKADLESDRESEKCEIRSHFIMTLKNAFRNHFIYAFFTIRYYF